MACRLRSVARPLWLLVGGLGLLCRNRVKRASQAMSGTRISELLDSVRAIGTPTDLDLLLFFYRHPHSLMTLERLAAVAGHDAERVAASLRAFIQAGLVAETAKPRLGVRILSFRPPADDSLTSLMQIASTRSGRLELLQALAGRGANSERHEAP